MIEWADKIFSDILKRDEPSWLKTLRQDCFDAVMVSGLPTKDDEDWKYSPPRFLEVIEFSRLVHGGSPLIKWIPRSSRGDSAGIAFVDGIFSPALSNLSTLAPGILILPMNEAIKSHGDFIRPYFEASNNTVFKKLNLSLMQDGFFIRISRDVILSQPIHVTMISTQDTVNTQKNLIIAEDGAQFTLVEEFVSETDQAYFNHNVFDVYLGQGSSAQYYKIQKESLVAYHLSNMTVVQDRDSSWKSRVFSFGALWSRQDLSVSLQHPGARCDLKGLYEIDGSRHVDHHTQVWHHASHTESQELYKGIMNHGATAVFNGKVLVHKGVKQVVAHQANHNLLLDKASVVNTKPELEIYADDVQCTHGATIGRLDDDQLFYLRARGIDGTDAKAMLIEAFKAELVGDIGTML